MAIPVKCPQGHVSNVDESLAGSSVRCPKCKVEMRVPGNTPVDHRHRGATTIPAPAPGFAINPKTTAPPKASKGPIWMAVALLSALFLGGVVGIVALMRPATKEIVDERGQVEAVVKQMIEVSRAEVQDPTAMGANAQSKSLEFFTKKAREKMTAGAPVANPFTVPSSTYEVGSAVINGDEAEAPLTVRDSGVEQSLTALLRREEGKWRLRGLKVRDAFADPGDPNPKVVTLNFENPEELFGSMLGMEGGPEEAMKDFAKEMEAEMKASFENIPKRIEEEKRKELAAVTAIKPMDQATFESTWRKSLAVANRPAIDIIEELADEAGFEINVSTPVEADLNRSVTLNAEGSFWQVVEQVCNAAGVYPIYELRARASRAVTEITFAPLPRPKPVAFAGPVLIELESLNEYAPYTTGLIVARSRIGEIPKFVEELSKPFGSDRFTLSIDHVTGDNGAELRDSPSDELIRVGAAGEHRAMLKGLLRNVETIKSCRGAVRFHLPAKVETETFTNFEPNSELALGATKLKFLGKGKSPDFSFGGESSPPKEKYTFEWTSAAAAARLVLTAFDSEHRAIGRTQGTRERFNDRHTAEVIVAGDAATIEATYISETKEIVFQFELTDLSLADSAKQAETTESLKFEGDAPVTSLLEGLAPGKFPDWRQATFRVTNATNKAICHFEAIVSWVDANGKPENVVCSHYSPYVLGDERKRSLLVAANDTASVEETLFRAPPPNAKVDVKIRRIRFADGSEWKAPDAK